MSTTIQAGGLLLLDPGDKRVIQMDWDALPASAGVSTSAYAITVIKQNGVTALTKDNESVVAGLRATQVRLLATTATRGDHYEVTNSIVTNENPAQTIERHFFVLIQDQ